jgi:predicted RecA/RadA family phage recombinase
MAARKPLVIIAGQVSQLPAGDDLDAPISGGDVKTLTNGEATPITVGQVVYISAASTVKLAKADASGTSDVIGLVKAASISAGASGAIQIDGALAGLTGLTSGAAHYLSAATAGALTTTAPSAVGQFVTRVGTGISTTELEISAEAPIAL